jgi:signal transduction histidine kinase
MTEVREAAVGCEQPDLANAAQAASDRLGEAIQLTRQLTVDLSPPVLQGEGLRDILRWLVVQMAQLNGLHVTLRAEHAFPMPNEDLRVLLYQIIRELLFNVRKHAATDQATVELQEGEPGHLRIEVSDSGRGFDIAAAQALYTGGFGLFSVREHLQLFGGHLTIHSALGHGTRVTLDVPFLTLPESS